MKLFPIPRARVALNILYVCKMSHFKMLDFIFQFDSTAAKVSIFRQFYYFRVYQFMFEFCRLYKCRHKINVKISKVLDFEASI